MKAIALLRRTTNERRHRAHVQPDRIMRRMWSIDGLPLPRAWFKGPRWRSLCGVQPVPIALLDPESARYHRPGRKLLVFTFEEEIRELVAEGWKGAERWRGGEELRPGVIAEWGEP